ncbi:MAG: OmpH family outer membrane protein [Bacteroidales bacterium]|nr:OmpH family outer membrane protein [Bacteroidales bacterium]
MKKLVLIAVMIFSVFAFATAQKFAYVDTDYILENIPEYNDAKALLDDLAEQWQHEIEEKYAEIDQLYKAYQAEAVLLPEDMKKKKEDEIIKKEKAVKELQRQIFGQDGELFKKRQELIKPIQEKIYNAIEEMAVQRNYAVIFDKSGSLTMLFSDAKYDLSDDVLDELGYSYNTGK